MLMYFFARLKKNLTSFMTKLRVLVLCFHYSTDNSNMSGFCKTKNDSKNDHHVPHLFSFKLLCRLLPMSSHCFNMKRCELMHADEI